MEKTLDNIRNICTEGAVDGQRIVVWEGNGRQGDVCLRTLQLLQIPALSYLAEFKTEFCNLECGRGHLWRQHYHCYHHYMYNLHYS